MLHVILAFKQVSMVRVGQDLQVQIVLLVSFSPAKKVEINIFNMMVQLF